MESKYILLLLYLVEQRMVSKDEELIKNMFTQLFVFTEWDRTKNVFSLWNIIEFLN